MLFNQRIAAVAITVFIVLFLLFRPTKLQKLSPFQYLKASGRGSPEILNATLGVSFLRAVSLRVSWASADSRLSSSRKFWSSTSPSEPTAAMR